MATHIRILALTVVALAALPAEAQRRAQRPTRVEPAATPERDDDRVTSITQLITPQEWRSHGIEELFGLPGVTVTNVGQAGDVPFGQSPTFALWEVRISPAFTGTGWGERFYFMEPIPKPVEPRPLLVFNHRFGKTNTDLLVSTDYAAQAAARGWYVVAPIAASNKHFLSEVAQLNTAFVLDWITNTPGYFIDMSRIYGVGFSMGGGMVMSYAARHLDPSRPMYAAVVNHTGDVSLNHVYDNENSAGRMVLDFWYGNLAIPGSADPLEMQRKSLIDFDPVSGLFKSDGDMVRNLTHLPLKMLRASEDLIVYLEVQNDALDQHLQTKFGYVNPSPTYQYDIVPFSGHEWSILDENEALDFLAQHTLQMPTSGQVLADRNARWFYFTTTLFDAAANAEFVWDVDALANSVSLTELANLWALTIETEVAGLDPLAPMTITVGSKPGQPKTDVYLHNFDSMTPSQVLLDGSPTGSYIIVEGILRLAAPDAGMHTWQIMP